MNVSDLFHEGRVEITKSYYEQLVRADEKVRILKRLYENGSVYLSASTKDILGIIDPEPEKEDEEKEVEE